MGPQTSTMAAQLDTAAVKIFF